MKNNKLTFSTSTNFMLPIGVYNILRADAQYYGFTKNSKENLSGFLNQLIPALSDYQEDLHSRLLDYTNDEETAKIVARSIHNVYLEPFAFHDDGVVNVPFRVNKQHYNDFMVIHNERLYFYDTDFTNYLRTLLCEYASKTIAQREYLFAFKKLQIIKEAISRQRVCLVYSGYELIKFAICAIETSPVYTYNYIVGIDASGKPVALRLRDLQSVTITNENMKGTDSIMEKIYDYLDEIYQKEYEECLV